MGPEQYIAVDLGAESGRVMLGSVSADNLVLEQVHRFSNGPIEDDRCLRWDFDRLLAEIKAGIGKAIRHSNQSPAGVGIDSWGVDFGLINADGRLIENPYHYRDSRTDTMCEKAFELMGKREIYEHTGLQLIQANSLYQLLASCLLEPQTIARAKNLLFIADLFAYHLCDQLFSEYTIASTSQLMDIKTGQWSKHIFDKMSLPIDIMPDIVRPGTIVGQLTERIAAEIGCEAIPVIASASHDTACAVAAVPAEEPAENSNWAFISSGTWSLIGIEVARPIINDKTFEYRIANEGGVEDTIRLLKNIPGLWLLEECRRQWQSQKARFTYARMIEMAQKSKPFAAHIDLDYAGLLAPGDIPKRINGNLAETGQKPIDDKGQMIRVILESLAFKYRQVLEKIEDITGSSLDCLHIVGGGVQNQLLCSSRPMPSEKK